MRSGSRYVRSMSRDIELDSKDWAILELLQRDALISNKALAAEVGLAPSTCLLRVRRLRESGVITGFHAAVSPAAVGLGVDALLAVQVRPHTREVFSRFADFALSLPETRTLFHVSGDDDFLILVSVADAGHLQRLVLDVMSQRGEASHVRTSLVYERTELRDIRPVDARRREPPLIAPHEHARTASTVTARKRP